MKMIYKQTYQIVDNLDELFFITLYGFRALWDMGTISRRAAGRIKADLKGLDLKGYQLQLRSDDLVHFYKSHYGSNETLNKHRPLKIDDVRKVPIIINQYDCIIIGNRPNSLLIEKTFATERYQLVVTIDNRRKTLQGKSFRILTRLAACPN